MRIYFLLLSILVSVVPNSYAGSYPKSNLERKIDEVGSILDNEFDVKLHIFSRGKKNISESNSPKVNKYLYDASINYLSFTKLLPNNRNSEIITTNWYSEDDKPGISTQIKIILQSSKIDDSSIKVFVYERKKLKNGTWSSSTNNVLLSSKIKDTILNDARSLYLSNINKQ